MNKATLCGLVTVTVLAADQATKALVLHALHGKERVIEILPFFNIVLAWNPGISFGLLRQHGEYGPFLLVGMSLAIAAFLLFWLRRTTHRPLEIALCATVAGALGNVIDRLRFGAVVDFLDVHAFGWHYPAFNIADSAIVLGIAFIVLDGLFFEPKREGTGHNAHEQNG